MAVIIIGFILGSIGLLLKIIGVCIRNEQICVVGGWFDSSAAGFMIGLGILGFADAVRLYSPADIQSIVDKSSCYTIDGEKRCGEDFHYENEKIKVEKKGHETMIFIK